MWLQLNTFYLFRMGPNFAANQGEDENNPPGGAITVHNHELLDIK